MIEMEFSLLSADPATLHQLQLAMQQFEAEQQIRVCIQPMPWDNGRAQLVDFALFKTGPDVSEIGTTWLGSFAAMNALRPFTSNEIQTIGEAEAMAGLRSYFQTFLPFLQLSQAQNLTETMSNSLFLEGKAAATSSGPWLLHLVRTGQAKQIVADNLGMAPAPGIPFIGGSNLVIF